MTTEKGPAERAAMRAAVEISIAGHLQPPLGAISKHERLVQVANIISAEYDSERREMVRVMENALKSMKDTPCSCVGNVVQCLPCELRAAIEKLSH